MQTITLAEVKTAALKAHAEGRLLAQADDVQYGYEVASEGTTYVCAIGASLNRESLDQIDVQGLRLHTIELRRSRLKRIFDFADEEFENLFEIQDAHDDWLCNNGCSDPESSALRESQFLSLLNA